MYESEEKENLLRRSRMPSQLLGGDLWRTGCIIHLLGTMLSALLCILCVEEEIHTITARGGVTSGQISLLAWWLENEHFTARDRSQVGHNPQIWVCIKLPILKPEYLFKQTCLIKKIYKINKKITQWLFKNYKNKHIGLYIVCNAIFSLYVLGYLERH